MEEFLNRTQVTPEVPLCSLRHSFAALEKKN